MNQDLMTRLKPLIASQLGVDEAEITPESYLNEDFNADLLSIADLIVHIEKEFGLKVAPEQTSKFLTVGDILNYISDQTGEI